MATAAVTARLPFAWTARRERSKRSASPALAFDQPGGPLIAVCGLTGGAGATTIALLLARRAAGASSVPIFLSESRSGRGLALLAGRATPDSLATLAVRAAAGERSGGVFAEIAPGLRLVASMKRAAEPDDAPVVELLGQAREAHGLVVVDCGTTWSADNPIFRTATHRIWAFPATPAGLAAARVERPAGTTGRDVAVAVARDPHALVSVRAIRRVVRGRDPRLVLIPYSEQLARGETQSDDAIAIDGVAIALGGTR